MYTSVKVSALSCRPRGWDKAHNADMVEAYVRRAVRARPDLVLTPEGVLEGYVVMEAIKDRAKRAQACLTTRSCDPELRQELQRDLAQLATRGFAHVVLHTDLLQAGSPLPGICAALFVPVAQGAQSKVRVYQLRSGPEWPI